ncbi:MULTISPECIES: hypothetical protein [unclassified Inquilinus]|uniref:hypothetical protein n=1 Tax=unclassified Inquilinus TaxID=2645927 RepID=UPI003F921BA0
MRVLLKILLAGLLLAVAACVSNRPAEPVVSGVVSQEMYQADALVPGGGVNRLAAPQSQAWPDSGARIAPAPEPRLGTRWGETIASSIRFVHLERLWPDRPEGQVTIRYDGRWDAAGPPAGTIQMLPVAYGRIEWAVLDARGRAMPLTPGRGGDLRLHGRNGDLYRLSFSNRGRQTVEIVATVDGLDVLSGQPGTIANRGYVVRPYELLVIEGFRQSEDAVAAFRFSSPGAAYAANTPQGDPRNIGVIGMAVFTLDDPANAVGPADGAQPFPADGARDPRFAPPPTP